MTLHIPRRKAMASVGALMAGVVMPPLLHAQNQGPIRIGIVAAKQGPFVEHGKANALGAEIALQQAGARAMGRPVELLWQDDPNAQGALQSGRKLVENDKAVALIGGGNSASAFALSSYAQEAKIPFIVTAAGAKEITGKNCHQHVFRIAPTAAAWSRAICPEMIPVGKRWYFLAAAFAFGKDVYAAMKGELQAAGGTEVGLDEVPLGTTDFSSYILKIRAAKPDVVMVGIVGKDIAAFMKQWAEFGMKDKIALASPIVSDDELWSIEPSAVTGTHVKFWDYQDPANVEADRKFADAVRTKTGRPATHNHEQGWLAMRLLLAALDSAKSTDAQAICNALEQVNLEGRSFRKEDHQMMHPLVVVKAKSVIKSRFEVIDVVKRLPAQGGSMESLHGSVAESGCMMKRS